MSEQEKLPIFITREMLEAVEPEIVVAELLKVASETGIEVYPRRPSNRLEDDELRETT